MKRDGTTKMSENLRVELKNILDQRQQLVILAHEIDWLSLEYTLKNEGHALYSTRIMLGLQILRLLKGLCDEDVCEEWVQNPYFQVFCGEKYFQHLCPVSAVQMREWRSKLGHDQLPDLIPKKLARTQDKPANFVIDIDGVVAMLAPGNDYRQSRPIDEVISAINRLYDRGHYIIMLTARGTKTGIDWADVTRQQFCQWGLKYHELHFGKPTGDYYVDDRMINVDMLCAMAAGREFVPSTRAPSIDSSIIHSGGQEGSRL
jgi:hypothetical protein